MNKKSKNIYAYTLLVPGVLLYGIFYILPSIIGLILSFANVNNFNISSITFAGWENYKNIFMDSSMSIAFKNTCIFSMVTTLFKVLLGLLLALLLNQQIKSRNYLRSIYFFPAVLNNVVVGLIFTALLHPLGMINTMLNSIGLGVLTRNWLTNPKIAIFSVSGIEIWKWTGFTMVLFLAGLQSIPKEYYEAAEVDGANGFQKFRNVTFPLIMPFFNNALVINIIGGIKVFELIYSVTQGGPGNATEVFGTLVFKAFGSGRYGEGTAAGILLSIVVGAVAIPLYKFLAKKEVEM